MFLDLKMTSKIHKFLLTWLLTKQVTGLAESSNLDMAPNAFDDQYEGCVQEMEEKAPQLLKEDFNMSEQLKVEWKKADQHWKKIKNKMSYPEGFHDFHGTALVAYTGDIHRDFNRAVREFRKNFHNFPYKAFHYYLTRALQLLHNKNCYTVYRGTKTKFLYRGKGSVRFGQFASSTSAKAVAVSKSFLSNHGTLFSIETCLGVDIKEFSFLSNEKEVLIPGYEVYQKVKARQIGKGYDGYYEISLDSPQRKKSNFNCFYSNSTDIVSSHLSSSGGRDSPALLLLVVLPGLLVRLLALAECSNSFPAVHGSEC
ncbi:T-cell ecto-ADP-ribosyltransferase 2-like [Mesocricetus auratus]|uniref:NAD(P)(+)--arginine ADP-ribosyltransferase n=1 Tax=Mesocricetus auratus TaxID=10036 RepID=A0A1U7QT58_MESAU|nr:T-cell ecto-ADP-ribosyltransferase 2-like [Mesocricetus auratus]